MLSKEEDITLKSLLEDILDTRKNISSLNDHIDELKAELPTPDSVERGDTHMGMAVDYLSQTHGLDAKEAEALARRSLLTENIAPGMEVWHFYADGVYGTTVTQGTARVSPYFLNVRSRRKLRQERDDALALAASLEAEITVLEATRDELRGDLRVLTADYEVLKDERRALVARREARQRAEAAESAKIEAELEALAAETVALNREMARREASVYADGPLAPGAAALL